MNYAHRTLDEFLSSIASENVVPAGGTVAAVAGASGTALCEMACIHTIEKDGYEHVVPELAEMEADLGRQRSHLLTLAETDASVIQDSFGSAAGTGGRIEAKRAIGVPLTIATACLTVIELGTTVTENCARSVVADARVGLLLAHAAFRASVFIARSNLNRVTDAAFIERIRSRISTMERSVDDVFEGFDTIPQ